MSHSVHDKSTAPSEARPLLEKAEAAYGFVPNLLGVMAESPALLEAYMTIGQIFEKTDFSATEKQVVLLAVSAYNECGYCTRAHTTIASMQGVPDDVAKAAAEGRRIDDPKLEALRTFTTTVVASRGNPDADDLSAFLDAGYQRRHVFDVLTGVGMKTLSNYTNHVARTPLDEQFGG
ncbi:MAG: carboxymuconolactone decarboxylase family protein [Pseudomonadota bacterium]|nr:MAG: carboxymuconolactone decarboxylase family protein [Pseudomonadota bacterium]